MSNKYYKVIAENRKARFDYTILETYKAGIVLKGTEVKSVRQGKVNLRDSFGRVEKGEVWFHGIHITPYERGNIHNVDARRPRKALLKQSELKKIIGKAVQKGFVLVPLKMFLDGNYVKIDLGLGKSKKLFEKKEKLKAKDVEREIEGAWKENQR
ncbi:MAG: SsrA-binding protein SmpB [Candidatus Saganbacteria bacterium]|nr:SsrA-binding protein SmpB [Candidatus Saganbacteria bacterium]